MQLETAIKHHQNSIKFTSKSKFAEEYLGVSIKKLGILINENEELLDALYKTGYKTTNKGFTPAQIRILSDYLIEYKEKP